MKYVQNKLKMFSIIVVLFIVKLCLFYNFANESVDILVLSAGILFFIAICSVINLFKEKVSKILLILTYCIISAIFFADIVFVKYFNQFPSVVVLNQMGQLGAVEDCLKYLLKASYFVMFLDIPIVVYLTMKVKSQSRRTIYSNNNRKKGYMVPVIAIAVWLVFLVGVDKSSEDISFRSQEIFTYHANDVFQCFFGKDEKVAGYDIKNVAYRNKPSDKYNAIAKDKNLIVIQVESLQNFVINREYNGQELTPNLNKLIKKDSLYYDRYYQLLGRGNTSDAEFTSNNSLYPAMNGRSYVKYQDNEYYGLPWFLKDKGYSTNVLHAYKGEFWNRNNAYPKQGFDKFVDETGFATQRPIGFGVNDKEFLSQSVQYIKELPKPYYTFLITLTSHTPYNMPQDMATLKIKEEDEGTLFARYLQTIRFVDEAIGMFIEQLKEEGLYENSIIAIYGDHYGLSVTDDTNKEKMTDYLGKDYSFDEMMRIPLIINVPNSNINETISTVGSQLDFYPTILNLLGENNNKGIMLGKDLTNIKEGFVAQQTYMLKGSFIKDNIVFEMSRDGIFSHAKAWNYNNQNVIDIESCKEGYEKAIKDINLSDYILDNNLVKVGLGNSQNQIIKKPKAIAHAGGQIKDLTYSNCKQALDNSVDNGFSLIETDFIWTSDNKLVLAHSWDGFMKKFFSVEPKQYSYDEFKSFKMVYDFNQMTLEDLANWIREHKDVKIVTDIKDKNIQALKVIKDSYPELVNNFIPQIYSIQEYIKVQELGYDNIILTLYMSNYTDDEIVDFAKRCKLYAVTMPSDRAETQLPAKLNEIGVITYTHTINDVNKAKEYIENGVYGVYTDNINPEQLEMNN